MSPPPRNRPLRSALALAPVLFASLLFGGACSSCSSPPHSAALQKPVTNASPTAAPGYDAIYFILIDRFANGDPKNDADADLKDPDAFHGGDLLGVKNHLDDLQGLGIRTIWLSPFFRMRTTKFFGHSAFHGYWVEDLRDVEPRFGTSDDLVALAKELKRRDMKLMLDVVLNHVGPDSPWVKERPTWFHGQGSLTNWNDPKQVTDHDVHGLPDLAQENPEVYAYLRSAVLGWVRALHPAGLRLDAVKHIPLTFWSRFNDDIRREAGYDITFLGEVLDGDPALLSKVQREGHFDALFDFPLHYALVDVFCRGAPPARLAAVFSQDRAYDAPERLVTLLDNHDLPRVTTDCGGDLKEVRQALAFLLTARGTPSITYGTESALEGGTEPANRGDMRFDHQPLAPDIRTLLFTRREHPSLTEGVPMTLSVDDSMLVYARMHDDEALIVAVNRAAKARDVALPPAIANGSRAQELTSGQPVDLRGLKVEARSLGLWIVSGPSKGAFSPLRASAEAQWRRGVERRPVEFVVTGDLAVALPKGATLHVVGSGTALGAWKVPQSPTIDPSTHTLSLSLAVGDVHEFKLAWTNGDQQGFEDGPNHLVFVEKGSTPLRIEASFRH